jgi:hypothetical protein
VSRPEPTPGRISGPGSMLLVMAHADDAELWAGGTIATHSPAGATIALGRGEPQRMTEAAGGARTLGARLRVLDQLTPETLAALLLELRPQVLVTHRIDDAHPDHRHAAQCALAALPEAVIATGHPLGAYTWRQLRVPHPRRPGARHRLGRRGGASQDGGCGMRLRRCASLAGALVVAAIAALASYSHMHAVALEYGQPELIADLLSVRLVA